MQISIKLRSYNMVRFVKNLQTFNQDGHCRVRGGELSADNLNSIDVNRVPMLPFVEVTPLVHGSAPGRNSVLEDVGHFVVAACALQQMDSRRAQASIRLRTSQLMAAPV
jgi:hypothetical protein